MFIEDPSSGDRASVTEENRLKTSAITFSSPHHINHQEGKAYAFPISVTPTGAGDCFAYITNTDDDDMIVDAFNLYVPTTEKIIFKLGDAGTASGGSDVTPVNLNAGSGNLADVTAQTGADITGLSGGSAVAGFTKKGGEDSRIYNLPPSLIIPKNKTLSIYASAGSIAIDMGVLLTFHGTTE